MRHYFDITLPYGPDLPVWPGEPKPIISRLKSMADGDSANVTHIEAAMHYGTHVDAPIHFIDGAPGVEALPTDVLIGRVNVIDLPNAELITADVLKEVNSIERCDRIIFKTRNSQNWSQPNPEFDRNYVAIAPDAAEILVAANIRLVGVDYLSVEPFGSKDFVTHKALLGASIVIVEGLDLRGVEAGEYEMACLPMKLQGADGAPARVVLWTED
jgi:arylformamidase